MKDTDGKPVVEIPVEALKDNKRGVQILHESLSYNRTVFNSTMQTYIRGLRETIDGHTMLHSEFYILNLLLDIFEREVDEIFWKSRDKPDKTYEYTQETLGGPRKLFYKDIEE